MRRQSALLSVVNDYSLLQWSIQSLLFRCFVKLYWHMHLFAYACRSTENLLAMPGNVCTCWERITGLWRPEPLSFKTIEELLKHGLPIDITGNLDM